MYNGTSHDLYVWKTSLSKSKVIIATYEFIRGRDMDMDVVHIRESAYATNSSRHQTLRSLVFVLIHYDELNLQYLSNHLLM